MVATRKSLSQVNDDDEASSEHNKALKAALRKLQIDGNAALLGEEPVKKPTTVYHYRGSVYEVTGKEPQEWLEEQPKRYKKRQSMAEDGVEEDEVATSQKRKHKGEVSDSEDDGTTPKRRRRQSGKLAVSEVIEATPSIKAEDPSEPEAHTRTQASRVTKSTRVNTTKTRLSNPKSRAQARKSGYVTQPIPEKQIKHHVGMELAKHVYAVAKLNTQMQKYLARYKECKEYLAKIDGARRQVEEKQAGEESVVEEGEDDEEMFGTSLAAANVPPDTAAASSETSNVYDQPAITAAEVSTQTPPATSPNTSSPTTTLPTPPSNHPNLTPAITNPDPTPSIHRHDSATSLQPTSPKPSTPASLPPTNKAGDALRHTLDLSRFAETGRAESAIFMGRRRDESKSGRRRRIRREMEVLRGWPVKGEGEEVVEHQMLGEMDGRIKMGQDEEM